MQGLLIGLISFIIIGVFHPIVTKGEYYFSKKIWPLFLIVGVSLLIFAYLNNDLFISAILSITGFTCLWSIHEIFEQEERVKKGWFPKNPKRSYEKEH
ncbi:MAG: DUF4491 family protein [Coprobacillaceae bacterium]